MYRAKSGVLLSASRWSSIGTPGLCCCLYYLSITMTRVTGECVCLACCSVVYPTKEATRHSSSGLWSYRHCRWSLYSLISDLGCKWILLSNAASCTSCLFRYVGPVTFKRVCSFYMRLCFMGAWSRLLAQARLLTAVWRFCLRKLQHRSVPGTSRGTSWESVVQLFSLDKSMWWEAVCVSTSSGRFVLVSAALATMAVNTLLKTS